MLVLLAERADTRNYTGERPPAANSTAAVNQSIPWGTRAFGWSSIVLCITLSVSLCVHLPIYILSVCNPLVNMALT